MMLRSEATTRIQRHLAFRTNLVTEIEDALQDTQVELELEATLPWFLVTEVASTTTVSGEERVSLPLDFIREVEKGALFYFNATAEADADKWVELIKSTEDQLRHELPGVGTPKAYYIDASYFRIFPTPDAAYILKMVFFKKDTPLTSDIENLWLEFVPSLMIGKAGQLVAQPVRDNNALLFFREREARGMSTLIRVNQAREDANHRYVMGGSD